MNYYTLNFIDESLTNKEANDIKSITDTLSSKERKLMNITGNHKPTGYKCFIEYDKDIPVSYFIIDKQKDNSGDVSFAVRSDYRSKGYAKKAISRGIQYIDSHKDEFTEIYWATKPDNIISQKLAEKYGFELVRDDNKWKTYCKQCSSIVNESMIKNEKDIYYNKDKFDSGEINVCFVTGLSGSGKTSMTSSIKNKITVDLDKAIMYNYKDDEFFEKEGPILNGFFKGPGKKYRISKEEKLRLLELKNYLEYKKVCKNILDNLLDYTFKYANAHKNEKIVVDGVWIFIYYDPSKFDKYAVYLKGTSAIISGYRAAKRGSNDPKADNSTYFKIKYGINRIMDDIVKEAFSNIPKWRKYYYNKINDTSINESILINEKDILWNKDKFDSGEINLCFVIGHSGSGKSTLGRNDKSAEHYELDDIQCVKDHFTMEQLKEYGDLIYSFFNGLGKKYYVTYDELVENKVPGSEYEDKLFKEFVYYAMKYAKTHKDRKYIVEGVWIFCRDENNKPFFQPQEFKDYAFYIKGTSMIISKHRGAKRDSADAKTKIDRYKAYSKNFFIKNWKWYLIDEKAINKFKAYFKSLMKDQD